MDLTKQAKTSKRAGEGGRQGSAVSAQTCMLCASVCRDLKGALSFLSQTYFQVHFQFSENWNKIEIMLL